MMQEQSFYVTEFNYLNKASFKINDLFCSNCKELFKNKIYTPCYDGSHDGDDANLCEQCYATQDLKHITYMAASPLINHLSNAQFPCLLEQCAFKGTYGEFHDHIKECLHGPSVVCPFEGQICNLVEFTEHLKLHGDLQEITLETLSIPIELTHLNKGTVIIVAHYKTNTFIVIIKPMDDTVSIKVMKHFNAYDPAVMNYKIIHQDARKQTLFNDGMVIPMSSIFDDKAIDQGLLLESSFFSSDSKITLYLTDYELIKIDLNTCPVCLKHLLGEIKLCQSDHAICYSCASKLQTCPVCRCEIVKQKLNLNHVLPTYDLPCENFDDGCMTFMKIRERKQHNEMCQFRTGKCTFCSSPYKIQNFLDHLLEHDNFCKNFETHILSITTGTIIPTCIYIVYRSNVFFVSSSYTSPTLQFSVKQVKVSEYAASKYRYEIILFVGKESDKVVAKVGNICNYDSLINISQLAKFL